MQIERRQLEIKIDQPHDQSYRQTDECLLDAAHLFFFFHFVAPFGIYAKSCTVISAQPVHAAYDPDGYAHWENQDQRQSPAEVPAESPVTEQRHSDKVTGDTTRKHHDKKDFCGGFASRLFQRVIAIAHEQKTCSIHSAR